MRTEKQNKTVSHSTDAAPYVFHSLVRAQLSEAAGSLHAYHRADGARAAVLRVFNPSAGCHLKPVAAPATMELCLEKIKAALQPASSLQIKLPRHVCLTASLLLPSAPHLSATGTPHVRGKSQLSLLLKTAREHVELGQRSHCGLHVGSRGKEINLLV